MKTKTPYTHTCRMSQSEPHMKVNWKVYNNYLDDHYILGKHSANLFARTREKQLDWLGTNTDDITTQSHSLFACSRAKKNPSGKRALNCTQTSTFFVTRFICSCVRLKFYNFSLIRSLFHKLVMAAFQKNKIVCEYGRQRKRY